MKHIALPALLSLLLCGTAAAQENRSIDQNDVEVGDVLICDTQEQVEHYIAAYSGDEDAAISAVNRNERGSQRCGVVTASFVRGPQIAAASRENMSFKVIQIVVLGVESSDGFRSIDPAPYFWVSAVTEYAV